jgi:PAS domain S-box-containing protein
MDQDMPVIEGRSTPYAVMTTDAAGRVVDLNLAARQLFGYEHDAARGRALRELVVDLPDIESSPTGELMAVGEHGRHPIFRRRVRLTGRRSDGTNFPIEAFIALAEGSAGAYQIWIRSRSSGTVPASRSMLLERMERVERLTHAATWEWEPDDERLYCSDALQQLVGVRVASEGISPREVLDRVHPDDQTMVRQAFAALDRDRELAPFEFRIMDDDGALRYIQVMAERADYDGPDSDRVVGVVRDVTAEWRAAERIKRRLAVSQALASWRSLADSAPGLLEAVTSGLGPAVATLWVPDGEVLVSRLSWVTEDLADCKLAEVANRLRLPKGVGLAGWAWQVGEPVDGSMLPVEHDQLYNVAKRAGFKTAVAFPALAEGEVVAVIDLHTLTKHEITEQALETLTGLSYEIGGVLAARRSDLGRNPLTARECEILKLAADGLTTPEIAARLVVERSTVKTHFEHIYGKLGVPDRAAAVAQALRRGLID